MRGRQDAARRHALLPHRRSGLLIIVTELLPDWLQSMGSSAPPPHSCPNRMRCRQDAAGRRELPPHSRSGLLTNVTGLLPGQSSGKRQKSHLDQLKMAREPRLDKAELRAAATASPR